MQKVEFRAMGCKMAVFLDNDGPQANWALQQVPGWFEDWEQSLSRFRADSELNHLNAAAGNWIEASPVLRAALAAAMAAARYSEGLVVPNMLESLERAGYDRSFERLEPTYTSASFHLPELSEGSLDEDASGAWRAIQIDDERGTIFLPHGTRLDLGGSAKGWAAYQAMLRLQGFGPVLVNAGGDIAASAALNSGRSWPVGIADPLIAQEELALLALRSCGVATSGIDYRRWLKDGRWKHHIIDPRTCEPAATDLLSVTIIAPNVLQAEAAAKVVMILGSFAGQDWLEAHLDLSALLVLQDGRLLLAGNMDKYLWSEK